LALEILANTAGLMVAPECMVIESPEKKEKPASHEQYQDPGAGC